MIPSRWIGIVATNDYVVLGAPDSREVQLLNATTGSVIWRKLWNQTVEDVERLWSYVVRATWYAAISPLMLAITIFACFAFANIVNEELSCVTGDFHMVVASTADNP
mgnify:FL=1